MKQYESLSQLERVRWPAKYENLKYLPLLYNLRLQNQMELRMQFHKQIKLDPEIYIFLSLSIFIQG